MAERFRPRGEGEQEEKPVGLIWWELFNNRYQAEVQEGVFPSVANFLIFDTENHDEILMNDVVIVGDAVTTDEEIDAWHEKAYDFLSELPNE